MYTLMAIRTPGRRTVFAVRCDATQVIVFRSFERQKALDVQTAFNAVARQGVQAA
jgi:hypothetical protein